MLPVRISVADRELKLADLPWPREPLDLLAPRFTGSETRTQDPRIRDWEVEIGFGKGKFLLEQARTHPERGYLGIEVASKYYRLARDRARRDRLSNLVLLRGEALYLLAAVLPRRFASSVHVYFPDPWPKSRHHGRRLFDAESLDLLLRLLKPGGLLTFATDYLEYGELVGSLLEAHPALLVEPAPGPWGGAPRTHYEDKYCREGRSILRLEARLGRAEELLHPLAGTAVLAATARPAESNGEAAS